MRVFHSTTLLLRLCQWYIEPYIDLVVLFQLLYRYHLLRLTQDLLSSRPMSLHSLTRAREAFRGLR
jgi:hypothetical protein